MKNIEPLNLLGSRVRMIFYVLLFLSTNVSAMAFGGPQERDGEDFAGNVFLMPNPMAGRSVRMVSETAFNGEYVKYMRSFPADLIRVEAVTNNETPAGEFLEQVYFPQYIKAGVPKAQLIEKGERLAPFGAMSYIQVRMVENGSSIRGNRQVFGDAIRTVLAMNVGSTLFVVSRQRDEEGFAGAFDDKILDPKTQLDELIDIASTIQVY